MPRLRSTHGALGRRIMVPKDLQKVSVNWLNEKRHRGQMKSRRHRCGRVLVFITGGIQHAVQPSIHRAQAAILGWDCLRAHESECALGPQTLLCTSRGLRRVNQKACFSSVHLPAYTPEWHKVTAACKG